MANGDITTFNGCEYIEWQGQWYPVEEISDTPTYHTGGRETYGGTCRSFTPDNVPTAPKRGGIQGLLDNWAKRNSR